MPELPDVAVFKRYMDATALHQEIESVEVRDVDAFIRGKGLGPDVLGDDFDFVAFKGALSGRRAMVKTTLMNQEIMAGIGNVYSDEILFQARLHPRVNIDDLDQETLHTLFRKLKSVLHTAIEHDANPDEFPSSFLTPHRQEGDPCPACEGQVERVKVSGRSAYYCPSCQSR